MASESHRIDQSHYTMCESIRALISYNVRVTPSQRIGTIVEHISVDRTEAIAYISSKRIQLHCCLSHLNIPRWVIMFTSDCPQNMHLCQLMNMHLCQLNSTMQRQFRCKARIAKDVFERIWARAEIMTSTSVQCALTMPGSCFCCIMLSHKSFLSLFHSRGERQRHSCSTKIPSRTAMPVQSAGLMH